MRWQDSPYTLNLLLSAAIAALFAWLAWRRRSAPGALPFALAMLSVAVWMAGYTICWAGADAFTQLVGIKTVYLAIAVEPAAFLVFAIQYTGKNHWLTRRHVTLLTVIPLLTLLLIWTNNWHGLFWKSMWLETGEGLTILRWERGIWSRVNAVYSYALGIFAFILLLQAFIRAPRLYRAQAGAVLLGGIVFWVVALTNSVNTSRLLQDRLLNLSPFSTALFGLSILFGLVGFRLFDIVPIARTRIVEGLDDGVIVLDAQKRIIDLNPAAQRLFGQSVVTAIGQPAAQALGEWRALAELCCESEPERMEMRLENQDYDVRASPTP
ncbi:MAG: PAS domain-containing protein [Anaerolineae bacterium]|nr:PAS domain-containing protein [Anaerolineae bacterium]